MSDENACVGIERQTEENIDQPDACEDIKLNGEDNIIIQNENSSGHQVQYQQLETEDEDPLQIRPQDTFIAGEVRLSGSTELTTRTELNQTVETSRIYELKKRILLYKITRLTYIRIKLASELYKADVFSDLVLGIKYFISHDWFFAFFTLLFVIGSSIFCNLFNKTAWWRKAERDKFFWVWIGPYFVLNMQPLYKLKANLRTVRAYLKHKKAGDTVGQISKHREFIRSYKAAAALKQDESLWEATPQIIIQLYKLFSTYDQLQLGVKLVMQLVSLSTSAVGLFSTRFTYHRAFHFPLGERVSLTGAFFMSVGYCIPLVCRAAAIASGIATSAWYFYPLVLLCHWAWCAQWWLRCGSWGPYGRNSFPKSLGLILQPSLHNAHQCLVSSCVLAVEDCLFIFGWAAAEGRFSARWPVAAGVFAVDMTCRTVLVLYWYHRKRFIHKVLDEDMRLGTLLM